MPAFRGEHIFFSSQLRFAVNADWVRFVFFAVWFAFLTVEHVIGAEVNQLWLLFPANFGERRGASALM